MGVIVDPVIIRKEALRIIADYMRRRMAEGVKFPAEMMYAYEEIDEILKRDLGR